ncbi:hypothetical protein [Actinomycetospora chiangmaiensis]|uniref:hypothetical protein n=1 Tax=Actinomycetospora chiangmaiensis TaxID=402650 RepID=UPI000366A532|nr:hypothetical protein [Actinomycetospora chiangmaiensis]
MDDVSRALLRLWDATDDAVAGMDAVDWSRPLVPSGAPDAVASAVLGTGGTDVAGLVTHLTGVHYAGPDRLRAALATAHERAERAVLTAAPSERTLQAQCLDMCLHAHDLHEALGLELDPAAAAPAAVAACRLAIGFVPRLLLRTGARAACLHLLVRDGANGPVVIDRIVRVGEGAAVPTAEVDADAGALLLLLAGRRGAEELGGAGRVVWSGRIAESLVGV